jgi:hypothetical protein
MLGETCYFQAFNNTENGQWVCFTFAKPISFKMGNGIWMSLCAFLELCLAMCLSTGIVREKSLALYYEHLPSSLSSLLGFPPLKSPS